MFMYEKYPIDVQLGERIKSDFRFQIIVKISETDLYVHILRRLPVTRGSQDDSDSTDSEEELESPKRILQQPGPAEKMDVDSNEGKFSLLLLAHSNTISS